MWAGDQPWPTTTPQDEEVPLAGPMHERRGSELSIYHPKQRIYYMVSPSRRANKPYNADGCYVKFTTESTDYQS